MGGAKGIVVVPVIEDSVRWAGGVVQGHAGHMPCPGEDQSVVVIFPSFFNDFRTKNFKTSVSPNGKLGDMFIRFFRIPTMMVNMSRWSTPS